MLRGLVTFCAPQSLTSFRSSRDELRLADVDIRLARFREMHLRSFPLALMCDFLLILQLFIKRWDFVILNSGAALLVRPWLLRICLFLTARRRIPTFILWRNAAEKFISTEQYLGSAKLKNLLALMADKRICHLAISDQTGREIEERLSGREVTNIRNCRLVPDCYLSPVPPSSPPVILNVASVNFRKAPDRFVATAIRVCSRNPAVEFHWVGGSLPTDLKQQIEAAGLSNRIRFIDHVQDPFEHMQQAYCLFLTSREEAFGLVLAEAMACARTVVCFAGTGASEVAGQTGRVFKPECDEALYDFLDELALREPTDAINLAARERYLELYSPKAYADNLAKVIKARLQVHV